MSKRNYIAEIEAKRVRHGSRSPRFAQFERRSDSMIDVAEFLRKKTSKNVPSKHELVKYLPIGWVACVEGYFRLVYRDLIDHGAPYRDNAAQLKDIRIGIDHVVAIHSGKLTFGEFIAHLLPIKSLDDVNQSMSTLLGVDYFDAVRNVKSDDFEKGKSLEELELFGPVLESLEFLFGQRHVFAHELAPRVRVSHRAIFHHSRAALILVSHTEKLLEQYI